MGQRGVSRSKQLRWYLLNGIMFHMKHRCFCLRWRAIVMKTRFFLQTCEDDPLRNWKVGWIVAILNKTLDPRQCCIFLCKEKSQWISIKNDVNCFIGDSSFEIRETPVVITFFIRTTSRIATVGFCPRSSLKWGPGVGIWGPYKWPIYNWGWN